MRRPAGGAVTALPGYAEGAWWVQDAAAALPARLFGDVAGRNVVDLCAAPGGKSAQLASAGAQVIAIDRSARRLDRLVANFRRLVLPVEAIAADALTWRPDWQVDCVLLDAPCTTTGAIRRHPDVPHLKMPDDVARLSVVQENLLRAAVDMLAPGGMLVYCTCSLEPEEGPQRIEALFRSGAPIARRAIAAEEIGGDPDWITAEGDLRTLPCHLAEYDGVDGFFSARLIKQRNRGVRDFPRRQRLAAPAISLLRNDHGFARPAGLSRPGPRPPRAPRCPGRARDDRGRRQPAPQTAAGTSRRRGSGHPHSHAPRRAALAGGGPALSPYA